MSSTTTQTTLNRQLYRQTFRILNTNFLHFITISFLFIPFTFSTSKAVQFYSSTHTNLTSESDLDTYYDPFNIFLIKTIIANSQNLLTIKTVITLLAFTLFIILPTVAGIALITYSTNQAINRKPLTFLSTIKSLSNSFIPLLSTIIAGLIQLILIFILITLSFVITELIKNLHFGPFIFSIFINLSVSYALVMTVLFFITIWGSAAPISVLESKSLFKPLQQSANQSAEFRFHSSSIVYFTGILLGIVWWNSSVPPSFEPISILKVAAVYLQSSLMILLYVATNTVLYVQCKVPCGKDVSGEYVSVAVNEKHGEVSGKLAKEDHVTGGFTYMSFLWLSLGTLITFKNVWLIYKSYSV